MNAAKAAGAELTGARGGGREKVRGAGWTGRAGRAGLRNCLDCLALLGFLLTTLLLPWPGPATPLLWTTCLPLRPTLTTWEREGEADSARLLTDSTARLRTTN